MAHDVGETLLNSRSEKTEVFSPISIYGALSLLLLGSSGNTYQELLKIMGLNKGKEFHCFPNFERFFYQTKCPLCLPDQYLANNSWKIHEEFGLLIDDIAQDTRNDAHPRYVLHFS